MINVQAKRRRAQFDETMWYLLDPVRPRTPEMLACAHDVTHQSVTRALIRLRNSGMAKKTKFGWVRAGIKEQWGSRDERSTSTGMATVAEDL